MRRFRAGSAYAAISALALFGTVSGSAVANVVGTGVVAIPMIRRRGFSGNFAGAVEAAASTGGQILPPIMGAAALVMADVVGVSYLAVISAVLVPAIACYASLFLAVFFEAEKPGISAAEDDEPIEAPDAQDCLKLLLVFGPIALIVWLLVSGLSPAVASIAAILMLFPMSLINPAIRRHPWKLIEALAERGLAFDRFCVTSPVCMPNRASRMTCRMPSGHGVRFNGIPLSKRNVTFVELLRDAGYDTALIGKSHQQTFTGIPPVLPRPETRPGLHRANGELSEAVRNDPTSPDDRLEEPSFWAGESPAVPTPFYGVDHVEVVTGHGDHLGDHQLLFKGSEQYEQITRVPFIWADPASNGRGRCDRLGQTLDIGATFLERARIEQAWGMQGRNLMAEESPPESVLIQCAHQAPMDGIGVRPNVHSLRDARYRISVFEGLQWGEL